MVSLYFSTCVAWYFQIISCSVWHYIHHVFSPVLRLTMNFSNRMQLIHHGLHEDGQAENFLVFLLWYIVWMLWLARKCGNHIRILQVALTFFNVRIISLRIRKAFVFSSSKLICTEHFKSVREQSWICANELKYEQN